MNGKKEDVRLQLVLPKELKDKVKIKAKEKGLTMCAFIRLALMDVVGGDDNAS